MQSKKFNAKQIDKKALTNIANSSEKTDGLTISHFGFEQVSNDVRKQRIQNVFSDVATRYDIMNDVMSLGLHRHWKNTLIQMLPNNCGGTLLDLAGGTGDIAHRFIARGGNNVVVCDSNSEMLKIGRNKSIDNNTNYNKIEWVHGSAESLPFEDYTFDYCIISFGIRNFMDINAALAEIYRVLKPGGLFLCLEFSHVQDHNIKTIYDFYSFNIIPKIGHFITGHSRHYQYLVESIRQFPKAHKFARMIQNIGFQGVLYKKLSFGIVAIHSGYKI